MYVRFQIIHVFWSLIEWILQNLEVVASILSASATVALAFLYRRQGRILNAQKEIQRVEQLPEIDVVDYTIEGDELEVIISNYGSGIGKNIRFCTAIAAPLDDRIEPMLADSRARRVRENDEQTLERTVNPHESEVRFRGTPKIKVSIDGRERSCGDFSTAYDILQREDPKSIKYQIYVVVDDQLGGCQSKQLFGFPPSMVRTEPENESNDEQLTPELSSHPSLEELWLNRGGLVYNDEFDLAEPDCRD